MPNPILLRGRVFERPLAPGEFADEEALKVLAARRRVGLVALLKADDQLMTPLAALPPLRQGGARATRAEASRHAR